jgi:threonyl-tRNA synthetase
MNCPHHCEVYARKPRSYKDLPLRIAEFGTVFRYEKSGELHGLTRVRTFTQDDAHIFVRPDQVKAEFEIIHRHHPQGLQDLRLQRLRCTDLSS